MVLECPSCAGDVYEEGCTPCMRRIKYYICSMCGDRVPNPGYRGARKWETKKG